MLKCFNLKLAKCKYEYRKINKNIILFWSQFVFVAVNIGGFGFWFQKHSEQENGKSKKKRFFKTDCPLCVVISNTFEWIHRFEIILFLICDYG